MGLPLLDHMRSTSTHTYTATTAGTGTALTATIPDVTLADGLSLRLKLHTAIGAGATLNVNGAGAKAIVDSKGTAVKAGAVANSYITVVYNGTNFILQGDGSDLSVGLTAAAGDILSGKTAEVNGQVLTGTMTNRGSPSFTPGYSNQSIPAGYYSGGTIYGDTDLLAANIKKGVSIFGVVGSLEADPLIRHPDGFDYRRIVTLSYESYQINVTASPSNFTYLAATDIVKAYFAGTDARMYNTYGGAEDWNVRYWLNSEAHPLLPIAPGETSSSQYFSERNGYAYSGGGSVSINADRRNVTIYTTYRYYDGVEGKLLITLYCL